jgi:sugar lactone lactonase YvrE
MANPVFRIVIWVAAISTVMTAHRAHAATETSCQPEQGMTFVCGPLNVEDMILIPGTQDLIASGLAGPGMNSGNLYWVDGQKNTAYALIPSGGPALHEYAACPSSFDPAKFKPHGIGLGEGRDHQRLLYVVNHGGRESIEIFRVAPNADTVALQWVGCVMLPDGASGNGVAPLPGGGFAATKFFDTRRGNWLEQLKARQKTGAVYVWKPGKGFKVVVGSEASGDNGVAVTADGRWLFVNLWPEKRIVRFALDGKAPPKSVAIDFMPDNIHLAADGSLLVGGHISDIQTLFACKRAECPVDWAVARLGPRSAAIDYLLWEKGTDAFQGVTGAIEMDGRLWLSTFRGDRIASVATPTHGLEPVR